MAGALAASELTRDLARRARADAFLMDTGMRSGLWEERRRHPTPRRLIPLGISLKFSAEEKPKTLAS